MIKYILALFILSLSLNTYAQQKCGLIKKITGSNSPGLTTQVQFEDGTNVYIRSGSISGSTIISAAFISHTKFCLDSPDGPFSAER